MSQRTRHPENSTDDAAESASRSGDAIVGDLDLARRLTLNLPGALETLIEQHGDHLQRLIRNLCNGACSADDLMQETLLRAWEAAGSYRGDAPLRHWLTQIAVRVCRNHQRGFRRWTAHLKSFWQQRMQSLEGNLSPSASTAEASASDAMRKAMSRLAHADRELLVLYYFEEQSLSYVAAQLGVRENTLHVRLHRSRERLRAFLENSEENQQ